MDELFAPPEYAWQRVSPRYLSMRRLNTAVLWPLVATVPAVLFLIFSDWWWIAALCWLAGIITAGVRYFFLVRTWKAWGYAEREDDLYISHGVWFRTLTVVPYGRMQMVEVQSGPVERYFGLASVRLKTASPDTDAIIPGLEPGEAARLRDQLTRLGEAQASGL